MEFVASPAAAAQSLERSGAESAGRPAGRAMPDLAERNHFRSAGISHPPRPRRTEGPSSQHGGRRSPQVEGAVQIPPGLCARVQGPVELSPLSLRSGETDVSIGGRRPLPRAGNGRRRPRRTGLDISSPSSAWAWDLRRPVMISSRVIWPRPCFPIGRGRTAGG